MLKRTAIAFFSIILLFSYTLLSQQDKNIVFKKLQKKYGGANSISIVFSNNESFVNLSSIKAKKTNKFYINIEGRKIICDGKTLWNYNSSKKNVIISNFSDELIGFSLDYFFFNIFDNLVPETLKSVLSSSTKKSYILTLVPSKLNETPDITSVELYLNNSFDTIVAIKINSSVENQKWFVKNIKINPKISDKEFVFKIPDKTDIIDYR